MRIHLAKLVVMISLEIIFNMTLHSFAMETIEAFSVEQERAIQIAKKAVKNAGIDLNRFDVEVNQASHMWHSYMSILKASPGEDEQALYESYSSKLRDREYWVIYFLGKRQKDGGYAKDDSVTVIIDKNTGEVLHMKPGG